MTRSTVRPTVVIAFIAAELWQGFFGALSSLELGAPGVGERGLWVPNVLVGEALTILPVGFILCLWGAPLGRVLAAACAAASLVVAVAAVLTLSTAETSFLGYLAFLAPPGLTLALCTFLMARAARRETTS